MWCSTSVLISELNHNQFTCTIESNRVQAQLCLIRLITFAVTIKWFATQTSRTAQIKFLAILTKIAMYKSKWMATVLSATKNGSLCWRVVGVNMLLECGFGEPSRDKTMSNQFMPDSTVWVHLSIEAILCNWVYWALNKHNFMSFKINAMDVSYFCHGRAMFARLQLLPPLVIMISSWAQMFSFAVMREMVHWWQQQSQLPILAQLQYKV